MSGISYNGNQFRLTIDTFDGAVGNEGTSSPESVGRYINLPNDVMLELENALVDIDGVARRRGTTKASAVGAYDITTATSGSTLSSLLGATYLSTSIGPYYGTTLPSAGTKSTAYLQYSAASGSSAELVATPVSRIPTIAKSLVFAGKNNGASSTPNEPDYIRLLSGPSASLPYNTGSITVTIGSAAITGSGTSWTSSMQGGWLQVSGEAAGYARLYMIRRVVSATSLILDEPYYGDISGAGKGYFIRSTTPLTTGARSNGPWGTATLCYATARLACEYGNRVVLGWTKEPAIAGTAPSDAESPEYPTRLRWGGIIGSLEGYDSNAATSATNNKAITGIYAWHANGFIDLNTKFGPLQAMRPFNGSLVVWQESGMTIIYGTPVYSGTGSIDSTTTYSDIAINGGFAYEETEHGIFFIDKKRGPMIYRGSGKPEALPMSRFIKNEVRAYDHVGYVNDHVLFLNSGIGSSTFRAWMYHVPTQRWSLWTNSSSFTITHPQRSNDHECVALLENGSGSRVISLDSLTRPDGTVSDVDGSTIQFSVQSKHYGDPGVNLRAERITATLRYTGTTPLIFGNIYNSTPLGGTPKIVPLVGASDSSPGNARLKTWAKEVAMDSGPALRVEILESSAAGHLEVARIVVEGTVEGDVSST